MSQKWLTVAQNTEQEFYVFFNDTAKDIPAHSWYPPGDEKILSCPLLCVPQIPSAEYQGLRSWCLSIAADECLKRKYIPVYTSLSTNIRLNQA